MSFAMNPPALTAEITEAVNRIRLALLRREKIPRSCINVLNICRSRALLASSAENLSRDSLEIEYGVKLAREVVKRQLAKDPSSFASTVLENVESDR